MIKLLNKATPSRNIYGVAHDQQVTLNAMLASCASGITVVNSDKGYGSAMAAFRILNSIHKK
jgi:hypothetical protein